MKTTALGGGRGGGECLVALGSFSDWTGTVTAGSPNGSSTVPRAASAASTATVTDSSRPTKGRAVDEGWGPGW